MHFPMQPSLTLESTTHHSLSSILGVDVSLLDSHGMVWLMSALDVGQHQAKFLTLIGGSLSFPHSISRFRQTTNSLCYALA